jgi:hypothetical protein
LIQREEKLGITSSRKRTSRATFSGEIHRELAVLALVPFEYLTHLFLKASYATLFIYRKIKTLVLPEPNKLRRKNRQN